jgi:hypothetical protein
MSNQQATRQLTHEEYAKFREQLADFITDFGLGRVKAVVNRRPEPKGPRESGRPKIWYQSRLFTIWLIVQTFAQREPKIGKICRSLSEKMILEDGTTAFSSSERIRRLFYEAEAQLEKYEIQYGDIIKPECDDYLRLKERLFGYSEVLSWDDLLLFDVRFADQIVLYELIMDGVLRCDQPPPPPLHLPELAWVYRPRVVLNRTRNRSAKAKR